MTTDRIWDQETKALAQKILARENITDDQRAFCESVIKCVDREQARANFSAPPDTGGIAKKTL